MNARATGAAPGPGWIPGWCICHSALSDETAPYAGEAFRTLKTPGDLAPLMFPAPWSFHLGLTATPGLPTCRLLANGFAVTVRRQNKTLRAGCIMSAPGILVGQVDTGFEPTLFSAEREIHRSADIEWIEFDKSTVFLARQRTENHLHFCLGVVAGSHPLALDTARRHIDKKAADLLRSELSLREDALGKRRQAESSEGMVRFAMEVLILHLRPPQGSFPHRWSCATLQGEPKIDVNQLYPLACSWSSVDPSVAADMVRTALSCQQSSGLIPAEVSIRGQALSSSPALPLIAQAVNQVYRTGKDRDFLEYALPKLEKYLFGILGHYGSKPDAPPQWQTPEEAWISETYDPEVLSADLSAFLVSEISAYLDLCADGKREGSRTELEKTQAALLKMLETFFWDPQQKCFPDRFRTGEVVERLTLSAFTPLLCVALPPRLLSATLKTLDSASGLRTRQGFELWTRWEEDESTPPVTALHQVVLLHAQRRSGTTQTFRRFKADLLKALTAQFEASQSLSRDLARPDPPSAMSPAASHPVSASLALETSSSTSSAGGDAKVPPILRWMDQHRNMVLATAVGACVLAILAIVVFFIHKKRPPMASLSVTAGLAHQYYMEGHYDEAINIYEELLKSGGPKASLHFHLGNSCMRKGDHAEAEKHYRAVLEEQREPQVLMNLALSLFRQNRLEEAGLYYRQALRDYGEFRPDIAIKAETALILIAERSSMPTR